MYVFFAAFVSNKSFDGGSKMILLKASWKTRILGYPRVRGGLLGKDENIYKLNFFSDFLQIFLDFREKFFGLWAEQFKRCFQNRILCVERNTLGWKL